MDTGYGLVQASAEEGFVMCFSIKKNRAFRSDLSVPFCPVWMFLNCLYVMPYVPCMSSFLHGQVLPLWKGGWAILYYHEEATVVGLATIERHWHVDISKPVTQATKKFNRSNECICVLLMLQLFPSDDILIYSSSRIHTSQETKTWK